MSENVMKNIRVEKVTVNIGVGEVGEGVERAVKLLQDMTGKDPVRTESSRAAQGFGLREGLNIGAKVTLRGDDAEAFLEKVLEANDNELSEDCFDDQGNFSLGVSEYIDMPNMKYNPDIGMQGFEVAVTLERPGYRVKERKNAKKLGDGHRISPDEAATFVQDRFGVTLV